MQFQGRFISCPVLRYIVIMQDPSGLIRQQEAEELSQRVQVMVVVGGKNSSNTNKLFETCHQRCPRSILVETPEDIPEGFICAEDTVALTAGASTPQWLLDKVAERITQMGTR